MKACFLGLCRCCPLLPRRFSNVTPDPLAPIIALGVGHDPDPFSSMRRPDVASAQHIPARIEPERGQISENDAEPSSSEIWGVLHEHVARSNLANDASEVNPQA